MEDEIIDELKQLGIILWKETGEINFQQNHVSLLTREETSDFSTGNLSVTIDTEVMICKEA